MPYIAKTDRARFDALIDSLAEDLTTTAKGYNYDGAFAGLLNYTCTRLALRVVRNQFGPSVRYWLLAIVTGVFKNIADEFYRRVGVPYEEKQITKSGDVDLYEQLVREISAL